MSKLEQNSHPVSGRAKFNPGSLWFPTSYPDSPAPQMLSADRILSRMSWSFSSAKCRSWDGKEACTGTQIKNDCLYFFDAQIMHQYCLQMTVGKYRDRRVYNKECVSNKQSCPSSMIWLTLDIY